MVERPQVTVYIRDYTFAAVCAVIAAILAAGATFTANCATSGAQQYSTANISAAPIFMYKTAVKYVNFTVLAQCSSGSGYPRYRYTWGSMTDCTSQYNGRIKYLVLLKTGEVIESIYEHGNCRDCVGHSCFECTKKLVHLSNLVTCDPNMGQCMAGGVPVHIGVTLV